MRGNSDLIRTKKRARKASSMNAETIAYEILPSLSCENNIKELGRIADLGHRDAIIRRLLLDKKEVPEEIASDAQVKNIIEEMENDAKPWVTREKWCWDFSNRPKIVQALEYVGYVSPDQVLDEAISCTSGHSHHIRYAYFYGAKLGNMNIIDKYLSGKNDYDRSAKVFTLFELYPGEMKGYYAPFLALGLRQLRDDIIDFCLPHVNEAYRTCAEKIRVENFCRLATGRKLTEAIPENINAE